MRVRRFRPYNETRSPLTKPLNMPEGDFYVFSAPSEGFRIQVNMRRLIKGLESMEGRKAAIINTHGFKRWNELKSMGKLLNITGIVKVAEADIAVTWGVIVNMVDGWEQKLDALCGKLQ